jgi:cation transporter-like permease
MNQQFDKQESEWLREHLPELRSMLYDQRLLYQSLTFGFVLGLVAHVAGFFLGGAAASNDLFGLAADLLYAAGLALWTGMVVVLFTQVWPAAKRRQIKRALEELDRSSGL